MEKINNILLNYKTYSAFQRDLNDEKISPNSIAFIQDNRRIWAHGKEYACNGLSVVDNGEGSISFVDVFGNTVLALSADPNGYVNVSGITGDAYDVFVSRGDFANYVNVVEQLKRDFEKYKAIVTGDLDAFVMKSEIGSTITSDSNDAVSSKAIYNALANKQDTLIPGEGIEIVGNTISSRGERMVTLSQSRYNQLVEQGLINPNTYYFTYEGEEPESYTWHFGDTFPIVFNQGEWKFGDSFPIIFMDNWAFGGTFPIILR